MMQVIGVCGLAGSGKNEVTKVLIEECGWVNVAFADEMKRICKRVYGFTDEQLWGPSEMRNAPDKRYPRGKVLDQDEYVEVYLSPRLALQELGSWGRRCYPDVWADYGMRVAAKLGNGEWDYNYREGAFQIPGACPKNVCISDVRFRNEMTSIKRHGGKVWRVVRPGAGLEGEYAQHDSETEQQTIPDSEFDLVIHNEGTLDELKDKVRYALVHGRL